ncbi:hypothetical protein L1049_015624 [Liquidambar formosana]|uniref:Protein FAR1-RELATED SEQUENCE n=1 Tax=Liquidambar formosana TaxID=63359 RepID=A0AAP0RY42_LIQFO
MSFVSTVMQGHKPFVGQEFDSLPSTYAFYNNYARQTRFSVRIGTGNNNWKGEITRKASGLQNVGCTEQDIRNVRRDIKKMTDGHDADMLNEHFFAQKEKNPCFTYTIETDDENWISYIFWANAINREAYKHFGDVVVFNTTYQTNRLAPSNTVRVTHNRGPISNDDVVSSTGLNIFPKDDSNLLSIVIVLEPLPNWGGLLKFLGTGLLIDVGEPFQMASLPLLYTQAIVIPQNSPINYPLRRSEISH